MLYNLIKKNFQVEDNQTMDRNLAELEAILASLQAKPSFKDTSYHLAGTRTSNTVFTRGSGTWTASELVGKLMVAFVNTDTTAYSVHKIASNTTTAITIDTTYGDASLLASADRIVIATSLEDFKAKMAFVAVS